MTCTYRFVIDGTGIDFVAPGELQKAEGCYLVVAQVGYDQALALSQNSSWGTPITIFAQVGDRDVAFMPVLKVMAQDRRGQFVQVACLVHKPDLFEQAKARKQ